MAKEVIAYLHTHWDREWYREFEIFRMRLLRVFDNVLELLESGRIPCFYFDGQICALEDYLKMRPHKKNLVKGLIYSKKLFIGPFYCLLDEFLTDKTCFAKNLEIGIKKSLEYGCKDFIGYLPDSFGHSQNIPDILMDFGIDKCIVWRGCGDFPADFRWCGMDTVNLVRGYFNDVFSMKCDIEKKAEILKKNLDLIAEKSGETLLLPIGADHLGIATDVADQIMTINEILKDDYNIVLGSPFDYFNKVKFNKFEYNDELRDCSKTFVLQGTHSSRLDLKRLNVEASYKLDLATRFVKHSNEEKQYGCLIEHAYKMLLENQAHDAICGCSTDDVHSENIIKYKKILQIAETIIDELKFSQHFKDTMILNLSDKFYSGIIEIKTTQNLDGYEKISSKNAFDKTLLTDTSRIPITEDYTKMNTFITRVKNIEPNEYEFILSESQNSDLEVSDTLLKNSNIELKVKDNQVLINNVPVSLIDFIDKGDSYNFGPKADDKGFVLNIAKSKLIYLGKQRASIKINFEGNWDIISLIATLDSGSSFIKLSFEWINSQKNHILDVQFELPENINEVFSEDMNTLIKRKFNPNYNIRENLPTQKGIEAPTNTAPMQRGLLIDEFKNNIGVVTKGLTQYEICQNYLLIPILRATGCISNPKNPARSTPAGPPLETEQSQMLGKNIAEMYVFFGNENAFNDTIDQVYNYIIT